jgi:hypothetical protein
LKKWRSAQPQQEGTPLIPRLQQMLRAFAHWQKAPFLAQMAAEMPGISRREEETALPGGPTHEVQSRS